ncbi:MAG: tyrosine-type recombinase/integrase [Solirubrobacteraceae bacterium]|jgi:integrase
MPRPNTGNVFEKPWADGETVSYVARVYAYGRREKVTLGTNIQGWNLARAELETEKILQQIDRGTWVPPRLEPREDRLQDAMGQLGIRVDETFRVFANRWWKSKRLRVDQKTVSDYEWRLGYLLRFFGRYQLAEITTAVVDRFRDELHDQAETIRAAQARAATNESARPLMDTVTDKRGRTYQRRRRPLSNTSINAMLKLLGQILQQAVDYELIDRNPVRVGERSARFLPRVRPNRTFLEIDEFHALLEAAGELEAEARADRQGLGRRAMCATLGLAGFRISEMLDLRCATVDLPRGRFKVPDAKTEAGVREVEMTLFLRDELLTYMMDRRARGLPCRPGDHFFGTASGGRRDHDRFRDRILGRAVQRASANRAKAGLPELPPITPHSMRRSWATFAASIGRDPKWIAAQIGHTDPQFTFSVYQQVATRRYIDEQAIWTVMRFADEPAERVPSRQLSRLERDDPRGPAVVEQGQFDQFLAEVNHPRKDSEVDQ